MRSLSLSMGGRFFQCLLISLKQRTWHSFFDRPSLDTVLFLGISSVVRVRCGHKTIYISSHYAEEVFVYFLGIAITPGSCFIPRPFPSPTFSRRRPPLTRTRLRPQCDEAALPEEAPPGSGLRCCRWMESKLCMRAANWSGSRFWAIRCTS